MSLQRFLVIFLIIVIIITLGVATIYILKLSHQKLLKEITNPASSATSSNVFASLNYLNDSLNENIKSLDNNMKQIDDLMNNSTTKAFSRNLGDLNL